MNEQKKEEQKFEDLPIISMAQARLVVGNLKRRVAELEYQLDSAANLVQLVLGVKKNPGTVEVDKPERKLNHERFGKDQGDLAICTWISETEKRISFELWLYSFYEPTEDEKEENRHRINQESMMPDGYTPFK